MSDQLYATCHKILLYCIRRIQWDFIFLWLWGACDFGPIYRSLLTPFFRRRSLLSHPTQTERRITNLFQVGCFPRIVWVMDIVIVIERHQFSLYIGEKDPVSRHRERERDRKREMRTKLVEIVKWQVDEDRASENDWKKRLDERLVFVCLCIHNKFEIIPFLHVLTMCVCMFVCTLWFSVRITFMVEH